MVLELGHFRKQTRNSREVFKYWGKMEKINCTDRVKNEVLLHRHKAERNIIHTIKRRKANWIGHILRRTCLLNRLLKGKRGKRRRQPLDDLKEKEYCNNRSHSVKKSIWKKLRICCKTDYVMNVY
jgi:hypothetical protein